MRAGETSLAGAPSMLRLTYDSGQKRVTEADALLAEAYATASTLRSHQLRAQATARYQRAAAAFEQVAGADPGLYQAWNMLGYARRKAGDPRRALQAYAMALRQKPGYGPAIEYRAEAHLAMGRLAEVRSAYRQLFGSEPALATQLEDAIRVWLRGGHPEVDAGELAVFREWFQGREKLADQAGATAAGWLDPGSKR